MSKMYIAIGVALSLFLHITFFAVPNEHVAKNTENVKKEIKKCPVMAVGPEEAKKAPEIVSKKPAGELPEPKKEAMQEVFKPDSIDKDVIPEEKGNIKIEEPTDEYMPALKVDISDYRILIGALRYFGMRVVLVDKSGNFVDEINLKKRPNIMPIKQSLAEYSNRIRMLPRSYFGERVEKIIRLRELRSCILVLADVDKKFAGLQKQIVAENGYELDEINATTGRFIKEGDKYRLVIERLCLKNGREELI